MAGFATPAPGGAIQPPATGAAAGQPGAVLPALAGQLPPAGVTGNAAEAGTVPGMGSPAASACAISSSAASTKPSAPSGDEPPGGIT